GAGRAPILRQLVIESLVLAFLGGAAGFLIALWGVSTLLELTPRNLIRVPEVPLDRWVMIYTSFLAILTAVAFGLAPTISAMRNALAAHLQGGGRSVTRSARVRQWLVVAQVGMTVILLWGAGLLVRRFAGLNSVPTGVDASDVVTMQVTMPEARYDRNQQVELITNAIQRIENLPGVQSAGATRSLPVIGPT